MINGCSNFDIESEEDKWPIVVDCKAYTDGNTH